MKNAPSLYSPLIRLGHIFHQLEANEGELTPELEAELQVTQQNLATRSAELLDLLEAAEAFEFMAAEKQKQAEAAKKQAQRFQERIKATLTGAVAAFGPIQADTRKVTLRESVSTVIDDEALIPDELRRPIKVPLQGAPDATAIKKFIQNGGTVPGARLQTNHNLQIK